MKKIVFAITLLVVLASAPWVMAQEASPYIIGVWKLDATNNIDTEFRFLNPTTRTLVLEYAFFEEDGTFCGCDRDTLAPNKTVVYTASGERASNLMICTGTNGALKSIVFRQEGSEIEFDEALQVGFQTHVVGNVMTVNDNTFGSVMTEAGMKAVPIKNDSAKRDAVRLVHGNCVKFLGK